MSKFSWLFSPMTSLEKVSTNFQRKATQNNTFAFKKTANTSKVVLRVQFIRQVIFSLVKKKKIFSKRSAAFREMSRQTPLHMKLYINRVWPQQLTRTTLRGPFAKPYGKNYVMLLQRRKGTGKNNQSFGNRKEGI